MWDEISFQLDQEKDKRYKKRAIKKRSRRNHKNRKYRKQNKGESVFLEIPGMELAPDKYHSSNSSSLPSLYPRNNPPPNVPRLPIKSNPHSRENTGSQLVSESMRADVFYNFS